MHLLWTEGEAIWETFCWTRSVHCVLRIWWPVGRPGVYTVYYMYTIQCILYTKPESKTHIINIYIFASHCKHRKTHLGFCFSRVLEETKFWYFHFQELVNMCIITISIITIIKISLSQPQWRWRNTRKELESNCYWKQGKVDLSYWWHFLLTIIILVTYHCYQQRKLLYTSPPPEIFNPSQPNPIHPLIAYAATSGSNCIIAHST